MCSLGSGLLYFFAYLCPIGPAQVVEKIVLSWWSCLHLCKKSIGHIWVDLFLDSLFCCIDLFFILSPVPHCHAYCSFILSLEIRVLSFILLFQNCIHYSFAFPYKLLVILHKKLGILIGIVLNLCRSVGKNWDLNNNESSSMWKGIVPHFCISFLLSFISFSSSKHRDSACFLKFSPNYFTF